MLLHPLTIQSHLQGENIQFSYLFSPVMMEQGTEIRNSDKKEMLAHRCECCSWLDDYRLTRTVGYIAPPIQAFQNCCI